MELPNQMVMFAHVVKAGSFSSAARDLGYTPSSVSRQIAHLEDHFGVRLLNRTNVGLSLTEEGLRFYSRCVEIADRIHEAETFANSLNDHPKGQLKVVSTVAFGKSQFLPILPEFLTRFPDVAMSLELTDRLVDLAGEGIDFAIRFSEQLNDGNDIKRRLARNRRQICASPDYVGKFGAPANYADLANHNCLKISSVDSWNDWKLGGVDDDSSVTLAGNFQANSADGVYHAALAGIGIARLSTYLISDDLQAGRLVRLLPDYEDDASDIVAIYSDKRNLSPKVRALLDYLVSIFGTVPPWERTATDNKVLNRRAVAV